MGFVDAACYFAIWYVIWPNYRTDAPHFQLGLDFWQLIMRITELGLWEAIIFELFKGSVCLVANDWGAGLGWCLKDFEYDGQLVVDDNRYGNNTREERDD